MQNKMSESRLWFQDGGLTQKHVSCGADKLVLKNK